MAWNQTNWHQSNWFKGYWDESGGSTPPVGPVRAYAIRRLGLQLGLFYRPYRW
jgi:hypothetical protein